MCQPGRPGAAMPHGLGHPGSFGLGRLPQHEIHRIALVGRDVDAGAGEHLVERAPRERSVARRAGKRVHRVGREQHVILGDIGDAARRQPLDQRDHLGDMRGRARLMGRRQAAERGDVVVELPLGRLGYARDRLVERQVGEVARGARVDLVVDVGDVAGVDDGAVAEEQPQQAEQHVEDDDRPRVADMGEVVDRRAADVHAHGGSIERLESLLRARQRVVQSQRNRHRRSKPGLFRDGARKRRTGRLIASLGRGRNGDANQPARELAANDENPANAGYARHAGIHLAGSRRCQVRGACALAAAPLTGNLSFRHTSCLPRPIAAFVPLFRASCSMSLFPSRSAVLSSLAGLVLCVAGVDGAKAGEAHSFVVAGNDGYGVEDCLGEGGECGRVVADAWCEAHGHGAALSFGAHGARPTRPTSSPAASETPARASSARSRRISAGSPPPPHGSIGTVEVEFFGEPSISLSV